MPVKVISDLHSAVDAMRQEVGKHDTLLLLGDLINIIDYRAMDGILVDMFGLETVRGVVELRLEGRLEDARSLMAERRAGREEEVAERFRNLVEAEYQRVFEAIPCRTFMITGNVDVPEVVQGLRGPNVEDADGRVIDLLGMSIGFVGGGLPTPLKIAGEIPEEEYDAKLESLGRVDVVCSHMPPDIPELTFDTLASRHERGSVRLLAYVKEVQPRMVIFGHIHQPMVSSMHLGRTHLLNAGYFRRTQRAFQLSA